MRKRKVLSQAAQISGLLILSTLTVMAQCMVLKSSGMCGGPTVAATCSDGCVSITYNANSPSETCGDLTVSDDGGGLDCGYSTCNQNFVAVTKSTDTLTPVYLGGTCVGCGEPDSRNNGFSNCEEDSIPPGAAMCGPCM